MISVEMVRRELMIDKIVDPETVYIYADWSGLSEDIINEVIEELVLHNKVIDARTTAVEQAKQTID